MRIGTECVTKRLASARNSGDDDTVYRERAEGEVGETRADQVDVVHDTEKACSLPCVSIGNLVLGQWTHLDICEADDASDIVKNRDGRYISRVKASDVFPIHKSARL